MAQFSASAERFDPYKNYRFQVFWAESSDPVAGVSRVSFLSRSTEPAEHREAIARPL
jgi:hypothetical protein